MLNVEEVEEEENEEEEVADEEEVFAGWTQWSWCLLVLLWFL